ncbi:MAG: phage holin family protein [Desulfitobacteriaceae bacterium]|nr:phage holin family protein [Desulfitobacteriaceae bacterium]MDD4345631.1 phage holin family protein [Desulfitobacteriaceae bacterium]MDD4400448.1 phage holin family protein [Desulfitobacteriaceae bacterium]
MFDLLLKLIINCLALFITAFVVPGFDLARFSTIIWAALVLGLVNTLIRPILSFFTIPLQLLTLGLFTLIINALMLFLTSRIVPGFSIHSFSSAIIGALVLSITSLILNKVIK